jgi:hypothetical protein
MFAGEGAPEKTNKRFHVLCEGEPAARLSTAFDSVTLYGEDPHERPDIYGKVGESGVSVPTLDDMKILYGGFDLCAPTTSVSMTINGPAPMLLAMFMNTAIDQQVDRFTASNKRAPNATELEKIRKDTVSVGPWHRAGRHPQRGSGAEHVHLLDRVRDEDDGRHPGVVHREQGAELLLGVDQRVPHRRSGREPRCRSSRSRCRTRSRSSSTTWRAA